MNPRQTTMYKQILFCLYLLLSFTLIQAQSVGVGTKTPDGSAMLDVTSLNKGLLIPRIQTLTGINDAVTITNPANSLLIYTRINNLNPGYYYNSGTPDLPVWVKLSTGNGVGNDWSITGNSGLNNTNFFRAY
ncbi:MAG: hypothetical protein IPJ81_07505 [Chitinophagaceae bacterium]|nr:hypothetical protein [Chitinophagaceae bacterium]